MERVSLRRSASLGAMIGVVVIGVSMAVEGMASPNTGGLIAEGIGGAIGGAFLFAMGAVVINKIRGR